MRIEGNISRRLSVAMNKIYTVLFDRIIAGEYGEGCRLRESVIADEFKVSRTPVREVFRMLEQDRLVRIVPRKGVIVFPFTADEVEDIYDIRESLELSAMRTCVSVLSLQKLIEIRNQVHDTGQSNSAELHTRVDSLLHQYIVESSRRRRLIAMIDSLSRLTQRFRELGFQDEAVRERATNEHLELIDALCERDLDASCDILTGHIQSSKMRVLNRLIEG